MSERREAGVPPESVRHLALVGLMGAGKTTVGRRVAAMLGRPFIDTDDLVVADAKRSIPEIFEAEGEIGFRRREREVLVHALRGPAAVIACGGGVVSDPGNRASLRAAADVVWLDAPSPVLAARVGDGAGRPLLAGGAEEALERLASERRGSYQAAAHHEVDASGTVEAVAGAVLAAFEGAAPRVAAAGLVVQVAPRPYEVVVGDVSRLVSVLSGRRMVALVTQTPLVESLAADVQALLSGAGVATVEMPLIIGQGESHKSLATIEHLCRQFARSGLLRGDAVVAIGGGMVGDVAGFAAAVYHRGVDVVQVPTTLLAMVDAAIGGKTAVNLPEGKNLVGAFHHPIAVIADPAALATLPDTEYRSGLGEVAKYALMGDDVLAAILVDRAEAVLERDPSVLASVIDRCARAKAEVVSADPEERTGIRARLNYGHTLAHALETVGGYDLRHGEAVAIGLAFAAELAAALERIGPAEVSRHRALLDALGLATSTPAGLQADELVAVMRRDKKAAGGLTFVLQGPTGIERVDDPDPAAVAKAFAAVGVTA